MKKLNFLTRLTALCLAIVFTYSCSSDDDNTQTYQPETIAEIAVASPSLSILVQALTRADLVNTLNGAGNFTVFAPTNTAFEAFLAANDFASVNDVPVDLLTQILLNHVIDGEFASTDLSTTYINTLATQAETGYNLSMFVDTTDGVTLNGVSNVNLNLANIDATNGIIHVVDAVIGLPTVVTFATADPNFSTLVTALTELTPNTDFVSILSRTEEGNGDSIDPFFTVFAPLNSAFDNITIPSDETTLTTILLHHVVSGANAQSGDLTPNGNTTVTTLQGDDLVITLPGTSGNIADVTDGAGNSDIGIVAVDVQASNGVIHALNKVALPNL